MSSGSSPTTCHFGYKTSTIGWSRPMNLISRKKSNNFMPIPRRCHEYLYLLLPLPFPLLLHILPPPASINNYFSPFFFNFSSPASLYYYVYIDSLSPLSSLSSLSSICSFPSPPLPSSTNMSYSAALSGQSPPPSSTFYSTFQSQLHLLPPYPTSLCT